MPESAKLGVPTAHDPPPGLSFPFCLFLFCLCSGHGAQPRSDKHAGKGVSPPSALGGHPWVGFGVGTGDQWILVPELGCAQGTEGNCFWSHRVKTVPLATKETMVNPGKR